MKSEERSAREVLWKKKRLFKKSLFIYLFLERGEGKETEEEKHQCVVASHVRPTGDLTHNPGMWPDWESNPDPLVHRPALNPLSYTSQGRGFFFFFYFL